VAVLLNIDAGELPDELPELYATAHIVNIACGGHAGDARSMDRVLLACAASGTLAGAHPSYPDREGFGRRAMDMTSDAIAETVSAQCAALAARAASIGVRVTHVKAHGALYHAANRDPAIARALVEGAREALGDIRLIGPEKGEIVRAAAGLPFLRERFCDRGERPDGSLVPRGEPGALVTDPAEAAARARVFVREGSADTVCVHGDTPGAIAIARAVRQALDRP
jgi:5-oxoprolinase (ATP-hydrolysing) subunit A